VADGSGMDAARVLALAAALERRANHPIAAAIAAHAEQQGEHSVFCRGGVNPGLGNITSAYGLPTCVTFPPALPMHTSNQANIESVATRCHAAPVSGLEALSAKDDSVEQQPGSGVSGVVCGHDVAVGSPDWLTERSVVRRPAVLEGCFRQRSQRAPRPWTHSQ
jgi:cation transport ATPase